MTLVGLMTMLGSRNGGFVGDAFGGAIAALLGGTGSFLVGLTALLAGALVLTGASTGALLRHSGHQLRRAGSAARERLERERLEPEPRAVLAPPPEPPVDVVHDYPDVVSPGNRRRSRHRRSLADDPTEESWQEPTFDADRPPAAVRPPGPEGAEALAGGDGRHDEVERADRRGARERARELRGRGDDRRSDRRPEGHPLRAPARAGHEGLEGGRAQGRPELCARDDGDQDPRADSRQAGGRRRGAEPLAADRHARRRLRRPAGQREPARRLARQGHLRQRRLGGSGPDAAHPDRRHDRLGQVRLHQHDPDLDPAPLDPGRGAADPDRPEADRAQLLRVDPAPPDAGRLEPEGGERRPHERRRRDGAPLRAALDRPRPQPARGEPCVPRAGRGATAVSAGRDRRAGRPDDDEPADGRGRDHPARAEVARRRDPPRAGDPAARRST